MHPERTRRPALRRAPSRPPAASSTAAGWNAFLLRPEARAWISATERGQRQPEVGDVALEVLLLEYRRPARLALGLVSSVALVVAATLSVATVTVLGPFWVGESGALFGFVVLIGFAVALTSVFILLRLQVSENRIIRAISVWTGGNRRPAGATDGDCAVRGPAGGGDDAHPLPVGLGRRDRRNRRLDGLDVLRRRRIVRAATRRRWGLAGDHLARGLLRGRPRAAVVAGLTSAAVERDAVLS
ncbi:hypothetical protein SAMN06295974_0936 [Plantibacter flavus]|uniref:Uncharacterized protein n=1 Tax=Plantibacter flavus TaxID=150123 RepID=A0A3N2C2E5_9MICO|nr:hypothetical protein [Plantibacter flavus]ROR81691.1 hypothetical protein EDD42_1762 [Plantibacter flavus]SMG15648.1 hypothetical protein SAMN06295974_0936 [Plantibacter flavus]